MRVFNQTISTIVDENYIYARALSSLGIEFYLHPNKNLGELCQEMGLVEDQVMKSFYLFDTNRRISYKELNRYPIQIVIQYLKRTHNIFVKDRLPYIAKLIATLETKDDLKLIFPEFVEEFIHHIHEEEDTVFNYIDCLVKVSQGKSANPTACLYKFRNYSLEAIHHEHKDEDELTGIRAMVDDTIYPDVHWKVISNEIKAFDREMMYHAQIENDILFPKALALESSINQKIIQLSQLN